ncbi:alpha/beta fold hydrolase [Shewanella sp. Isolate11]|uniref:alpha/beta fold hydrolase n=1 Tax=Shewanella sp. Isolate11 TaxID=2908530 RepID=UPI001EFC9013|nr:alpha/beta fold hydrolase [Shewanella sp. Isolate11]MCG9697268.1 alpha/beta fold hydrolase [Shewanella sp. Isolate11]
MTAKFVIETAMQEHELPASECLLDDDVAQGSGASIQTLVLFAHGAGANMQHAFMQDMAQGLAKSGLSVVRFNFPYMRNNAIDGKRRPPDRAPKLLLDFNLHIAAIRKQFNPKRLILVGKSMGGRMAAMIGNETRVDGVICLGYPFVPPKGGEPRLEPIAQCRTPLMVIQGERDKFGGKGQVESWLAPYNSQLKWLTDGDHSFAPRKSSGTTQEANLAQAISDCVSFIRSLHA